jgi:hypothetical protein
MAMQITRTALHEQPVAQDQLPKVGVKYALHYNYMYLNGSPELWSRDQVTPCDLVVHWTHKSTGKCILAVVRGGRPDFCRPGQVVAVWDNRPRTRPVKDLADKEMDNAIWQFMPSGDSYYLWNTGRGQYLATTQNGTLYFADSLDGASTFDLEEHGQYESVRTLYETKVNPILVLPDLIDNVRKPPDCAIYDNVHKKPPEDPVAGTQMAGVCALPYFLITNDHGKTAEWQGEHSPYYLMTRESCWSLPDENFKIYPRGIEEEKYWEVTEGTTEESAREVDEKTSWGVTAEAGFSYGGFGAKASGTYSEELSIKTSTKRTKSHSQKKGDKYKVYPPDNDDLAVADFFRRDEYVVRRVTGEEVLRFKTWHIDPRIGRTFPKGSK